MNILGTGGHARVVLDIVKRIMSPIRVFDDDRAKIGSEYFGYRIEGQISDSISGSSVIAIGNNKIRREISNRLLKTVWGTLIHPNVIIAEDVYIGEGSVIMAGAILQPGVVIGRHCIINTGAIIDHDCVIEDFAHIAPNSSLAGGVCVGEGTLIGIGSSVFQNVRIGSWTTLGAGSVVIEDIPSNCTAVGVPARPIKFHDVKD